MRRPSPIPDSTPGDRTPHGPWLRTWSLALALAAAALIPAEAFWRHRGFRPMLRDTPDLWTFHRARLRQGSKENLVLLGTSRMHAGVHPPTLRERWPGLPVTQLAASGHGSPVAVLRDLAEDPAFRGVVVCEIVEAHLERAQRDAQQPLVDLFHNDKSPLSGFNLLLRREIDGRLAFRNPYLNFKAIAAERVQRHRWPPPAMMDFHFDRTRIVHIAEVNWSGETVRWNETLDGLRRPGSGPARDPEAWLDEAMEVAPWVRAIRDRGGNVVFLRMPTSHPMRACEEITYPRNLFWDRFAARIPAVTLHFEDIPAMRTFRCPDLSHLDGADAPRFTTLLAEALVARGVVPPQTGLGVH